jgi:hypothetical protein
LLRQRDLRQPGSGEDLKSEGQLGFFSLPGKDLRRRYSCPGRLVRRKILAGRKLHRKGKAGEHNYDHSLQQFVPMENARRQMLDAKTLADNCLKPQPTRTIVGGPAFSEKMSVPADRQTNL